MSDMKTTPPAPIAQVHAVLGESRYGTAQPRLEVEVPRDTHYRAIHTVLHRLAADVNAATPEREQWLVQIEVTSDIRGRVYLELSEASPAEAERGMALLRAVLAAR